MAKCAINNEMKTRGLVDQIWWMATKSVVHC